MGKTLMTKIHALTGRPSNNLGKIKPDGDKKLSHLNIKVFTSDKALWVKAAQANGVNLTAFVIETLNKEIGGIK